jgi:hypothetical protein
MASSEFSHGDMRIRDANAWDYDEIGTNITHDQGMVKGHNSAAQTPPMGNERNLPLHNKEK